MDRLTLISFSLRRSGMHGILNWICRHRVPSIYFSNCTIENNRIRTDGFIEHDENDVSAILSKNDNILVDLRKYKIVVFGFEDTQTNLYMNNFKKYEKSVYDIFSISNKVLINNRNLKMYTCKNKCINNKNDIRIVYIIRDIYNLIASRLKVKERTDIIDTVWKPQVLESLNNRKNHIDINFNLWFTDIEYRKSISRILNFEFNDEFKNRLGFPISSSFDGKEFFYNANEMKVLERYKHYINDDEYLSLFDAESIELNKLYFRMNGIFYKE